MADNYVSTEKEITVPFSDDQSEEVSDDQLIVEEEKLKLTNPEEASRRKEKRRERAQARERERKQQEQELRTLRESSQKTERELAELRGFVTARANQPAPAPAGKDEFEAKLDALDEEREAAYAAAQAEVKEGKITPERNAYWSKKGRAIEERRAEIIAERTVARHGAYQEQRRQQEEGRQFWRSRHPEVYQNQQAYRWAEGRAAMVIAENRREMTQDEIDSVLEEAKVKFKLGKQSSAPTATERARMMGVPSSGGGGGNGKGATGIQMTRELKMIAEAKYSDLPQEKAWQKWTDNEGKALRERKVL